MDLETEPRPHEPTEVSLAQFVGYFLWLGTVGFGGPIALAGHMQQDLVDERRWISKQHYLDGLALAQLAPGPLAAQLAIYLGYVRAGVVGATAVAVVFVLPSFLMVLALSAAYVRFGGLAWMQGMFYGMDFEGDHLAVSACGHAATFWDLLPGVLLKSLHIGIVESARRILTGIE